MESDSLDSHQKNIDCPIRCADCTEIFHTKSDRMSHCQAKHGNMTGNWGVVDIDEELGRRITSNLKAFSDAHCRLRKGTKRNTEGGFDISIILTWATSNVERYRLGRKNNHANFELGQWYIIFSTVFPEVQVPDSPCKRTNLNAVNGH